MAKEKITKRRVDALLPGETVFDTELKGFMVRARIECKSYAVKYSFSGRQRIYTLGMHGPLTPDEARRAAAEVLGLVAQKIDPQAQRRLESIRGYKTFQDLAELYMAEHSQITKKPRSVKEDERLLRLNLVPALGKIEIEAITKADIFQLRSKMKTRPVAFNRSRTLASSIFNFAIQREIRQGANPITLVPPYPEKNRERFLSQREYAQLFEALTASEGREHPSVIAGLRLLTLTGARLSEVLTLKWDWVDFDHAALRLPDSKTGAKVVSLPAAALKLLSDLPRNSKYVLPGLDGSHHFVGIQRPWRRIRDKAGLANLRIHDLRHGFASMAAASGESMKLIGAALGHRQSSTTDRYAHLSADPVRALVDRTAAKIASSANQLGELFPFSRKHPH